MSEKTTNGETISQEDLLKSIQELEQKAKGTPETPTTPAEKTVATEKLAKATDAVQQTGSEDLKKALEVSDTLAEFAGIMGVHMDTSLEALQKTVQLQGQQNVAILGVLGALKKSLDELKAEVAKLGEQPAAPAKRVAATKTTPEQVLNKGTESGPILKETDPAKQLGEARKVVLAGLTTLVKNAKDPADAQSLALATAKFEATGAIDKVLMERAYGAFRQLSNGGLN